MNKVEATKEEKKAYIDKVQEVMRRKNCNATVAAKELHVNKMRYYKYLKDLQGKPLRGTKPKRTYSRKKQEVITMVVPEARATGHVAVMSVETYKELYL